MAGKKPNRTVFAVQDSTGLHYFFESNMRCVPSRGLIREDKRISFEQARPVMIDLANFYKIPILLDSFQEIGPFEVLEQGLFGGVKRTLQVLVCKTVNESVPKISQIIPIGKHEHFASMDLAKVVKREMAA